MMAESTNQRIIDGLDTQDQSTTTAIEWLTRSYESMEHWKRHGREIFFSLNGQSDAARNRSIRLYRG